MGKASGEQKRSLFLSIALCAAFYIYALGLLILYLFTYSEYEAQKLASFSRYMDTIVLGVLLFDIFLVLNPKVISCHTPLASKCSKPAVPLACVLLLLFALCNTGNPIMDNFLLFKPHRSEVRVLRDEYHIPHAYLDQFDYKTDRIQYISQGSHGFDYHVARFNLTPVPIDGPWSLANEPAPDDLWTAQITAEQWGQLLISKGYTYVYLFHQDEQFKSEFGELFENSEAIQDRTFYRVTISDNGNTIKLIPCHFDLT